MADQIGPIEVPFRVEITGTADALKNAFRTATAELQGFGKNLSRMGADLQTAGRSLTAGITAPIIGLGTVAVVSAARFETAMTGVAKTLDTTGLTAAETDAFLAGLSDEFKRLSEEIPVSARELAGIAEVAAQLGVRREDLASFTRVMADLGVTTNLSAEEAATALAQFANITGASLAEVDRLGSTIVELGNRLVTTERQVTEFGLRIAGAGELAGLAEAEILAIGAAMASVGVESEAGGTAVQKVLLGMQQAVATGNKELAVFAATAGMSAAEFSKAFKTDAAEAFTLFVEGLGKSGDDAFKILEALHMQDQRLMRSFLSLAGAGDLLRTSIDIGNKAWAENIALSEEAERFYGTSANQLIMLRNALENAAIELGVALIPALKDLIPLAKDVTEQLAAMAKWFGDLPGPVQKTMIAAAGLFATIGPSLWMLGSMAKGLDDILKLFVAGKYASTVDTATVATRGFFAAFVGGATVIGGVVIGLDQLRRAMDKISGEKTPWWALPGTPGMMAFQGMKPFETGEIFGPDVGGGTTDLIGQIEQAARNAAPSVGELSELTLALAGSGSVLAPIVTEMSRAQEGAAAASGALSAALAAAGESAKKKKNELAELVKQMQIEAAEAGISARGILALRLERLNASAAVKEEVLALFDLAEAREESAEKSKALVALEKAQTAAVKNTIKALRDEARELTGSKTKYDDYTEAVGGAITAAEENIDVLAAGVDALRVSEDAWGNITEAINRDTQEIARDVQRMAEEAQTAFLQMANDVSGGFVGKIQGAFKGLQTLSSEVFGGAGGGILSKIGGFGSSLMAMAGPAGAIFGAVSEIGKLFGIDLVGMVEDALGKLGEVVRAGFKSITDSLRDKSFLSSAGGVTRAEELIIKGATEGAEESLLAFGQAMLDAGMTFEERRGMVADLVAKGMAEGVAGPAAWTKFFDDRLEEFENIPRIAAQFGLEGSKAVEDLIRRLFQEGLSPLEILQEMASLMEQHGLEGGSIEALFQQALRDRVKSQEDAAAATKLIEEFGLGEIESARAFVDSLIAAGKTQEEIWETLADMILEARRIGFDTAEELEDFFADPSNRNLPGSDFPRPHPTPVGPAGSLVPADLAGDFGAAFSEFGSTLHAIDLGIADVGNTFREQLLVPHHFTAESELVIHNHLHLDGREITHTVSQQMVEMVYGQLGLTVQNK